MDINVKCASCETIQTLSIVLPEDKAFYQVEHYYFDEDKKAKTPCKACSKKELIYYVDETKIPGFMGGSKNYMSMERYWSQNKGEQRRQEDTLAANLEKRHYDRVTSKINKQQKGLGRDKRHEGYGKGQGEQKLNSDS